MRAPSLSWQMFCFVYNNWAKTLPFSYLRNAGKYESARTKSLTLSLNVCLVKPSESSSELPSQCLIVTTPRSNGGLGVISREGVAAGGFLQ